MTIDMKVFEKKLAEYKVYDAWQYVNSLRETLGYMTASYEMLIKVHEHRIKTLNAVSNSILTEALNKGKASCTINDLEKTNLNIGGYELDDAVFLRKTTMEFFHYARISMDVLFQIVNAALLGDEAIKVDDKKLLRKLLKKLRIKSEFSKLLKIMNDNKSNSSYKYLMAFDNYMKHIKTILVTVKTSILFGNDDEFYINEFSYNGKTYPEERALDKVKSIYDDVQLMIDNILSEVLIQIPNCWDNSSRIQNIHFKQLFTEENGKRILDYMSFFIDVDNELSELPCEIKVFPLIVKPNDEIYSFDFKFDKIFIRKKGTDENEILGVATIKNGFNTNEFYRIFEVKPCTSMDYRLYLTTFKEKYSKIQYNIHAMDGRMIFIGE